MSQWTIEFPSHPQGPICLDDGTLLSDHLARYNAPILFGCRDGACASCLVTVEVIGEGELTPPDEREQEVLDVFAPNTQNARLACQLRASCHMKIRIPE